MEGRHDRHEQFSNNHAQRIENRQEWQQHRSERLDYVHDYMDRYPLRGDFWLQHPNWGRWAINRPYRWATWSAVTSWFPWGWNQPTVYDYGTNIYYSGDQVYYDNQPYASADEYTEQAYEIAQSGEQPADSEEWMSLGVFAITPDGDASELRHPWFVQLAVSKSGAIAGSFYDQSSDKSAEIEGAVDKKSQQIAFCREGQDRPNWNSAGIANLSEDLQIPALFQIGRSCPARREASRCDLVSTAPSISADLSLD
jgi:hypothetical protein